MRISVLACPYNVQQSYPREGKDSKACPREAKDSKEKQKTAKPAPEKERQPQRRKRQQRACPEKEKTANPASLAEKQTIRTNQLKQRSTPTHCRRSIGVLKESGGKVVASSITVPMVGPQHQRHR